MEEEVEPDSRGVVKKEAMLGVGLRGLGGVRG